MFTRILVIILSLLTFYMCSPQQKDGSEEMRLLLVSVSKREYKAQNTFSPQARLVFIDSLLKMPNPDPTKTAYRNYLRAGILLELGKEKEAARILEELNNAMNGTENRILRDMSLSYLRLGERSNCIAGHAAASCVLPLRGLGVHADELGSRKAVNGYSQLVENDPADLESRWLLNIAYMTLDEYPEKVPVEILIPGMEGDTIVKVKPFEDIAGGLMIDVNNMAGGSVVDDFDNDGYLDIISSSMDLEESIHYFHNDRNGTFSDRSAQSGLSLINGGLNMVQADYDNDGDKDLFVPRGAWKAEYGEEPNSLIRNNGDGTFSDVTKEAGMLRGFFPTQAVTWNDFNNDGWLDLYIGNESNLSGRLYPNELYLNNRDGTFSEIAASAGVNLKLFVKGVTSGDYNNDGWQDIFVSTMNEQRVLFKNMGLKNGKPVFKDVSIQAGISGDTNRSFTTWFFDYDNDGWLDIFACDYTYTQPLSYYAAAEKLNIDAGCEKKILLYHNNHDDTFTEVAKDADLNRTTFAMGGNFGDVDNDGYLDIYLGTGNPQFQSLIPNKMYKNMGGRSFADVTYSARVGHLQKGHGVAFADMDNDGDQDISIDMGGVNPGDSYPSSFFLNPGQNDNRWIVVVLEGDSTNRGAVGARVRVDITENGEHRSIYRDVNSGGSFGSSPLRREIGIGQADRVDAIEIWWPVSNSIQRIECLEANQFIKIKEGSSEVRKIHLNKLDWILVDPLCTTTP
jgi:hypothetical protein